MKLILTTSLLALCVTFSSQAHASETGPWEFALNAGINSFTDGSGASQGQFGAALGYAVIPEFSAGVEYSTGGNYTQVAAELNYNFLPGGFVGFQGGPVNYGGLSGIGWGPQVGYDFDLGNGYSVGPELQYQMLSWSSGTIAGQSSSSSVVSAFATLSCRF